MSVTGAAIGHAEIARLIGCLNIEITTGMTHSRGSSMLRANAWSGSSKRTKKGALEDLVLWLYRSGGDVTAQWAGIGRSLGAERTAKLRRKCERASLEYVAAAVEKAQEA